MINENNISDQLPDCTLLNIFSYFDAKEILKISSVCSRWSRIGKDEQLWKYLFKKDYRLENADVCKNDHQISWLSEYRRFKDECPKVAFKKLTDHKEHVLHTCFNHSGSMLATSSKDGTLKVWSTDDWRLLHDKNLQKLLYWRYTLCAKFNGNDRLLLVSGLRAGESAANTNQNAIVGATGGAVGLGELAVFEFMKKVS
jgi:WD40 repeat protein